MKVERPDISLRSAAIIAAFLSIGPIAIDLAINYPYPKIIHTGLGEIFYNVGLFTIIQYVINVGVLLGIPKIPHHI
jgi:hypothetical protein